MQVSSAWRRALGVAGVLTSVCILFFLGASFQIIPARFTKHLSFSNSKSSKHPWASNGSISDNGELPYSPWAGSLDVGNSDFLGPRPSADQVANLTLLVEKCRGSYKGQENLLRVNDCLQYLANNQHEYLYLPDQGRASESDPRKALYADSDGQGNILESYPDSVPVDKKTIGSCKGPVIPYHTYWSGKATWRVELMLKSYLHTQNLECSRFWLWVDSELNPNAAEEMKSDPAFVRFLPLVARGDIILKAWHFPERIRLFLDEDDPDRHLFFDQSRSAHSTSEVVVGDGIIRTPEGEEWIVFGPATSSVLPTAISDAVRFVVLHQYGGVYMDMDGLLLRDLRPLLLFDQAGFAERWGIHLHPSNYNTQITALKANSSLSSYLLHGGVRMGMNFHPRAIGTMLWKDKRNAYGDPPNKDGFLMLETALFDPLWGELDGFREGSCIVPCMHGVGDAFQNFFPNEWVSLPEMMQSGASPIRTLENFFKGAWNYHVHNQWRKEPEPESWLSLVRATHDRFFAGEMTNFYGEMWHGPSLSAYERFQYSE